MQIKLFFGALAMVLVPLASWAADAPAQLRQFVDSVATASGTFKQQTHVEGQRHKTPQSGAFSFERPGKFRWHVEEPYEQLIVSDGKSVLQYDPDLAQVTERSVDQSVGASPAAILFGSGSLDESFDVTVLPEKDGLKWLRAVPKQEDAGFVHVDIGLSDNLPKRMLLLDAFGQTTQIDLANIVSNPSLDEGEFRFVPPAGVDVIRMQ